MKQDFDSDIALRTLIRLKGRAERLAPDQVVESFSSVGPLQDLLATEDHQVIFGRRGTGKTHALRFLYSTQLDEGDCALFVDMRSLGSDGSMYSDPSLPVTDRTTRLLLDTLAFIQDGILDYLLSTPEVNLTLVDSKLEAFNNACAQVRVTGETTATYEDKSENTTSSSINLAAKLKGLMPGGDASVNRSSGGMKTDSVKLQKTGVERLAVRFPNLSSALRDLCNAIPANRIWVILDEWSSLPQEVQPFLADMLRRAFFTIPNITVKIGAIEHRTKFLLESGADNSIGLEPTADVRNNVRLDEFLLFDNDKDRSVAFFKEFLFKHVLSYCREKGWAEPKDSNELYRAAFNQKTSFEEFVKSCEGVPRDALHIVSSCAQMAYGKRIDIPIVRTAGHKYYQDDKSSQVDANPALRDLLQFIVDKSIRQKKTNAFLLEAGSKDRNVDLLFDRRLIHLRQKNVSSRDRAGTRYYHYKIDYGCYVDLIATNLMPQEVAFDRENKLEDIVSMVEVPGEDDGRSYRRSILEIQEFYESHPEHLAPEISWRTE
ncbi:hypothetical protein AB0T83_00140 [Fluviibacterium sp. DFM31]|uniref:ATP-binding protein n=1 Tax=Meridianimarinicoccus marinus TaxID=3231483 RepID=A0ABV3L0Y2_9RHOB